jgi:hypothetical protein
LAANLKEFVKRGFAEGKSFGQILTETIIVYLKSVAMDSGFLAAAEDLGIAIGKGILKGIAQAIKSFIASAPSNMIDVIAKSMLAWVALIEAYLSGGSYGGYNVSANPITDYNNSLNLYPESSNQLMRQSIASPGSLTIINNDRRYSNGELASIISQQVRLGWGQLAAEGVM